MRKKPRNNYDLVLKGLLQRQRPSALLDILTGGVAVQQVLNIELSKPLERRADAVFLLEDGSIFHLEAQTTNDQAMPYREGVYCFLLGHKYPGRLIHQTVLYLGPEKMRMPSKLDLGTAKVAFTLIDIRNIDAAALLASGRPADLPLAMLARGGADKIQEIFQRVASLKEGEREKVLDEVAVLCGLRRLEKQLIMELKHMSTAVEIYRKVPKIQEMLRDADQKARIEMLRDQMELKFRILPKWASEKLESASPVQVRRWSKKILDAKTLEDVLGKSQTH